MGGGGGWWPAELGSGQVGRRVGVWVSESISNKIQDTGAWVGYIIIKWADGRSVGSVGGCVGGWVGG